MHSTTKRPKLLGKATYKVQAFGVGCLQAARDEMCGERKAGFHAVEVNQRLQDNEKAGSRHEAVGQNRKYCRIHHDLLDACTLDHEVRG